LPHSAAAADAVTLLLLLLLLEVTQQLLGHCAVVWQQQVCSIGMELQATSGGVPENGLCM
jgi:hypothetical protein